MLSRSVLILVALFLSPILYAEDEVIKEPKPPEEVKPKEGSQQKAELKDVEVTGSVLKKEGKNGESKFYIKTEEKLLVTLPNKIGDKEVNLEEYKDKQVVAKGKGQITLIPTKKGDVKIIKISQLLSINLKDAPPAEKKEVEEKK